MRRVERKVTAASVSAAVAGVVLSVLSHYVFKGEVPADVQTIIYTVVPPAMTFIAGWAARHTDADDLYAAMRAETHPAED